MKKKIIYKYLTLVFRLILGGVFIYSGVIKMGQLDNFLWSVQSFELFPKFLEPIIIILVPFSEVALAIFFILGRHSRLAAFLLSGLILFFLIILSIKFFSSDPVACGCLDVSGKLEVVTWQYLVRDLLLLVLSVFVFKEAD